MTFAGKQRTFDFAGPEGGERFRGGPPTSGTAPASRHDSSSSSRGPGVCSPPGAPMRGRRGLLAVARATGIAPAELVRDYLPELRPPRDYRLCRHSGTVLFTVGGLRRLEAALLAAGQVDAAARLAAR